MVVPSHRMRRAALYAGGFLGPFGGGMVTVLVPELRNAFGVSTAAVSLALTSYLVPFAALQLVSGTLGERLGRARATRAAFAIYTVASLVAAATGAFAVFLAARAVQGAANAFTTPLVLAALADDTPDAQLGQAVGTFAAVQTAGVVGAPLVGGLAGALDYRLAFVVAAGLVLAALIVGAALLMRVETRFRLFGYPGFAILLFLFAGGSGVILLLTIAASDRRRS
jgi:MFS family permease